MNKKLTICGFVLSVFFYPATVYGILIRVPEDHSTIQAAIGASQNGDTVLVAAGTYTGNGNKDLEFMGKSITLLSENGPDACIIDCEYSGRGFFFHNAETAEAILDGFTIRHGATQAAGGIYITSSPTIQNCIITENSASLYGGGMSCLSGSPTIINCVFSCNTSNDGGGLECAPLFDAASPVVLDCNFINNASSRGGAVYCGGECVMMISNCLINGNNAVNGGGGIFSADSSFVFLEGTDIFLNESESKGGAIFGSYETNFSLNECTISMNEAGGDGGGIALIGVEYEEVNPTLSLSACSINDNSAQGNGGGLFCEGSSSSTPEINIEECSVNGNNAAANGGGIYYNSSIPFIANSTISENTSGNSGSGIYSYAAYSSGWFTGCLIENNSANSGGGGMAITGSHPPLINCLFYENSGGSGGGVLWDSSFWGSSTKIFDRCVISGNIASGNGGGISVSSVFQESDCRITNCTFDRNEAVLKAGGLFIGYKTYSTIANCSFTANTCESRGAAVTFDSNAGEQVMLCCTVSDNVASVHSGGIWCNEGVTLSISNSILWENFPTSIDGFVSPDIAYSDVQGSYPGIGNIDIDPIFVSASVGDKLLSHIEAGQPWNSPCIDAGSSPAINVCFNSPDAAICMNELTTRTDEITDNGTVDMGRHYDSSLYNSPTPFATPFGTASPLPSPTSTPSVQPSSPTPVETSPNLTPTETPSPTPTIILYVPSDHERIQDAIDAASDGYVVIVENGVYSGEGNKNLDFHGKMITVKSSGGPDACIIDCEFSGRGFSFENRENQNSVVDGFTVRNGSVSGNYPDDRGGGILCKYDSNPVIHNCRIVNNASEGPGGGISCHFSSPFIKNCLVSANSSADCGGGIACYDDQPFIEFCEVSGNHSDRIGGGISCSGYSSAIISNCTIKENTAAEYGGGINADYLTTPLITNCLLLSNYAAYSGGGFYCSENASTTINGSSFSMNSANSGGAVYSTFNTETTIQNCILWNDSANSGAEITIEAVAFWSPYLSVSYSNVEGGISGVCVVGNATLDWGEGMIDADPLFALGPQGDYYLSQVSAGQMNDSPCIDAGSDSAENISLPVSTGSISFSDLTTRTDEQQDAGLLDIGFHYAPPALETPTPLPTASPTPTRTPTSTASPAPTIPAVPVTTSAGVIIIILLLSSMTAITVRK